LRRVREVLATYVPTLRLLWKLDRMRRRIQRDPLSRSYSDLAITPVSADDANLELFHASEAAVQAAARAQARAASVASRERLALTSVPKAITG
jgi:hypothetical protein